MWRETKTFEGTVHNPSSSSLLSNNIKIQLYRTIIFPWFLYGRETLSLILREERRLSVSENRVLTVFGPKRDEVTGEWKELHNENLNNLCCSPNIIRVIISRRTRWAGHAESVGREEVPTGFWWGNRIERDHLEDPGVDGRIILRHLQEVGWGSMDWTDLAQDRGRWRALVNAVMNLRVP